MEPSMVINQTKQLSVDTTRVVCVSEGYNMLMNAEKGQEKTEIWTMDFREVQPGSGGELHPKLYLALESVTCGNEVSGQKEYDEESYGEDV